MTGRTLVFIGCLGLALGAVLPSATLTSGLFGTFSISGLQGDGLFTGGIGVLLFLIAALLPLKPGKAYSWAASILAVIALFLAGSKVSGILAVSAPSLALIDIGSGVWLSTDAAFIGTIGGLIQRPAETASSPAATVMPPVIEAASKAVEAKTAKDSKVIHECFNCGVRNAAGVIDCAQCGAPLPVARSSA
jgi:hypothetical protein